MNKKIAMVLGAVLVLVPVISLANEIGTTTNRYQRQTNKVEERRTMMNQRLDDREGRMEDRAGSSTIRMEKKMEKRQDRVRAQANQIFTRLNRQIDQLTNILTRVDSRIGKLEGEGKDTSAAKTASAEAKALLDQARNSLPALQTQVDTAASSSKPVQSFQPVKTDIKNTITLIKQAHQKIVEAIKTLAPKNN